MDGGSGRTSYEEIEEEKWKGVGWRKRRRWLNKGEGKQEEV